MRAAQVAKHKPETKKKFPTAIRESRGKGIAQAMIAHLRALGEKAGWFKIFWMTQHDNFTAQHLYDKVAKRMDYIRYDLNVSAP